MTDIELSSHEAGEERAGMAMDSGMTREEADKLAQVEAHRHRVRRLLRSRADRERWHVEYFEVLDKKDPARARKERADANAQWELGNRGAFGVWLEETK